MRTILMCQTVAILKMAIIEIMTTMPFFLIFDFEIRPFILFFFYRVCFFSIRLY